MKSYKSSLIRQKASVSKLVRVGLCVVLSASMVFSSVPTSAIYAYADEELENSTTENLKSEDVPSSVPTDDGGGEDPQGSDPAVEPTEPAPGEAPADETPADDEPADGQSPSDEKDLDAEEPSDPTTQEASEEEEEENKSDEGDSPEGVSLAPMAMLGGPLRAAGDSDIVYQGINNPTNTTIDLFDYWITSQNASDRTENTEATGYYGGNVVNKGINAEHTLLFHGGSNGSHPETYAAETFTGMQGSGGSGRWWEAPSYYWGPVIQGIVQDNLVNGYPVLSDNKNYTYKVMQSDGNGAPAKDVTSDLFYVREGHYTRNESLEYLFNPDTGTRVRNANGGMDEINEGSSNYVAGKASYPDVNGLFSVDDTGYYIYDSHRLAATYNQGTNRYELSPQQGSAPGYWPLDGKSSGTHNDYMGMHMNMSFSMPAKGEVLNPQGEYVPMTFTFTGDDDVWVFVDGKLVGDAGGIHQPSSLQINFKTGEVNVNRNFEDSYQPQNGSRPDSSTSCPEYVPTTYLKDIFGLSGDTFEAGTYHTIDFFYLERGNSESNLEIRFNMVNTGDFTAHKALVAEGGEALDHNRFQFELIGLDGKYKREGNKTTLVDASVAALMPKGASSYPTDTGSTPAGPGDVSRYWHRDDANNRWIYRVGAAADGNVNFGNADFTDSTSLGETYRYIIQEVSTPGIDYEMDKRVYYMEATVAKDDQTGEKYLSKRYYTDDTFTTRAEDVNFASFVNLKGDVPKATPRLIVNKDLTQNGGLADITAGQFAFEAVDSHGRVVATCGASDPDSSDPTSKVVQATLVLPTLTAVDFDGVVDTTKTYTYTIREVVPDNATDNGDGTFTLNGVKYKYDRTVYKATFTAKYTGTSVEVVNNLITYKDADDNVLQGSPTFHNYVPASISVVKAWKNAEGAAESATMHNLDSVWVQLYKQTRTDANTAWSGDTAVGDPVELNKNHDGTWSHSFELADDATGSNVRYIVKEGTMSEGTFTPLAKNGAIMAAKSDTDQTGKPYTLDTAEWTAGTADDDGYMSVAPYGSATETITNKPLQADIKLLKVDADSAGGTGTLADVSFKLYKDAGEKDKYEKGIDIELVTQDSTDTFKTADDGTVKLPKLDPGTYWLMETSVPDGYLLRDANHPIGIKVEVKDGVLALSLISDTYDTDKTRPTLSEQPDDNNVYTLTVRNVRLYALPSAGGPGVYPFLLVGAFAAAFAASETLDKRKNPSRSLGRHGRLGGL